MTKIFIVIFAYFLSCPTMAEIIKVSGRSGETTTAYWSSHDSKALLIFMPGGDGSFNIASKNPPKPPWILNNLFQASQNYSGLDIVFFDSPYSLGMRGGNIAPRYTNDHLVRMLDVIRFYKEKTQKPIFLIGHSNGTISEAEFLNQASDNQKLISGLIFSGTRNEASIKGPLSIPILFLHHLDDANGRWTSYSNAEKLYKKIKEMNEKSTLFSTVHGGEIGGDPSTSGHHMYEGSFDEASNYVWHFIFDQDIPK